MTTQLALFQDDTIKKTIITVPVTDLKLSRFNPRNTRPDEDIDKLAERISRNGFEITRALWAYQNGSGYEVFAGGTRLEAAKRAGVRKVPIVLHEGLSDEDIVRLADEDNENDEYHAKVGPVDVWAHYAMLRDDGWDNSRIAQAKDVSERMVRYRLNLHNLPAKIKSFGNQGVLTESHFIEIYKLEIDFRLKNYIKQDQILQELATITAKRHLTTRQTKELVNKWKEFIALATDLYSKLDAPWQNAFIHKLKETQARSKAAVQTAYSETVSEQLDEARRKEEELARQQSEAESERLRLQREKERQEKVQRVLDKIILGDFAEVALTLKPKSVDVIITDPPYPEKHIHLYGLLAEQAARLLKPDGSLLTMCGQSYLPEIFTLMTPHLNYYWTLSYQTPGGQSPQIWPCKINTFWKPVLWFVKGDYQGDWHGDVIKSDTNDNDKRYHHWGQSESGVTQLVEKFSQPGDVILDPFCGGGTVGVIALSINRQFIGIDIDKGAIETTRERIIELFE